MRDYASILPVCLDFDLRSAGWSGSESPYPGIASHDFACIWLRKSLLKKFTRGSKFVAQDAAALSLFLSNNERCRDYRLDTSSITTCEAVVIGEAKNWLYDFFYPKDSEGESLLTLGKISRHFGFGDGANIGSPGTDFLSKVGLSTMAATDRKLHDYYAAAILHDPLWADVESFRRCKVPTKIVQGSRTSFVPKTAEISRTICTEPVLNMMFQKGIAGVLEERLKQVCGIDLSKQSDKNRVLARIGSRNGNFGTIDLSSASDTISLNLVREVLPPAVVNWLEITRCSKTVLPDGRLIDLHMVSSMGNAFTFPLQTLLFTSLVYGVYRVLDLKINYPWRHSLGNFAVFGDDIIVHRRAYNLMTRMLSICGFSVNVDKSFNDGFFRESCGRDYFHGYDVRGVYLKRLDDVCDVYSAINRLNLWSARHGIPLPLTISALLKGRRFLPVPFDEQDVAGIKVPWSVASRKLHTKHGAVSYRYLDVHVDSIDVSRVGADSGKGAERKLRGWYENPSAILLSALAGKLRMGFVSPRSYLRRIRVKTRRTPRWDYVDVWPVVIQDFGSRWKTMTEANLALS